MLPIQTVEATSAAVQTNANYNTSLTSSFSVNFPSQVTYGDLLVAMAGTTSASTSLSVSDTQLNRGP